MLRPVALVRTDVLEESIASIIRMTRMCEPVTSKVVYTSLILVTLIMEATPSSETSVLTRTKRRNIPEDGIIHSYRRVNLKSDIAR
jgi:hypothetical protein